MIWEIEVALRAWSYHRDLACTEFVRRLNAPKTKQLSPQGANLTLFALAFGAFQSSAEPAGDFDAGLLNGFRGATQWLSALAPEAIQGIVDEGFTVDVIVDVCMDQDQLDLTLPTEFMAELVRLQIPFGITTRNWDIEMRLRTS